MPARKKSAKAETARLKALAALDALDEGQDEAFETAVSLARDFCDAPVALVTLVDRDTVRIRAGLDIQSGAVPRKGSFCDAAIAQNGVLSVPNANADPRFRKSVLVAGDARVRAYHGAPIIGPDDQPVGALSVIHFEPTTLSERRRERLQQLADMTGRALRTRLGAHQQTVAIRSLHTFVENSPMAVAMFDKNMRYVVASRRWMTDYNLGDQDVIGRSHYDVFPEIPQHWKEIHQRCLAGGVDEDSERFDRADGTWQVIRWNVRPWRTEAGEIGGIVMLTEDVTELTQVREAREREAQRLEVATKSARIGIWEYSFATGELSWDRAMFEIYGIDESEFGGTWDDWTSRVYPSDLPKAAANFQAAVAGGGDGNFQNEFRTILPDGSERWVRAYGQLVGDAETGRVVGVNWDATAEIEDRLRLEIASQAAGIGVFQVDFAAFKAACDARSLEIFGIRPQDFNGDPIQLRNCMHPDDRDRMAEQIRAGLRSHGGVNTRLRIQRPDGEIRHINYNARLIGDLDTGRLTAVVQDVTTEHRALEALETKTAEAEAASEAKSAFLASMSHEIRTPMNGVLGMAAALATTRLDDRQREMLKVVNDSGAALMDIINDILDISKIEAGKLEIDHTAFQIEDVVRGVEALYQLKADNKQLRFEARIDKEARGGYLGDPTRIRQVLHNLISNAIKFTKTGGVLVTVSRRPLDHGRAELLFAISDTGIGVPDEKRDNLFAAFQQVDSSTTRRFGGTGLGLSICRRLCELMGGWIAVDSAPGDGSTFTFGVPLVVFDGAVGLLRHDEPADLPAAEPPGERIRVLVAEDNAVNQQVVCALLDPAAFDVALVANGEEAVARNDEEDFDVVLMDVQMPVLDGVDATKAIRAQEAAAGKARTPIIALTANAMKHQVESYLAAGMDAHVAKPIVPADLYDTILAAAGDKDADGEGVAAA